jgi:hypothetical protein
MAITAIKCEVVPAPINDCSDAISATHQIEEMQE